MQIQLISLNYKHTGMKHFFLQVPYPFASKEPEEAIRVSVPPSGAGGDLPSCGLWAIDNFLTAINNVRMNPVGER
jgi:hypothetical protein